MLYNQVFYPRRQKRQVILCHYLVIMTKKIQVSLISHVMKMILMLMENPDQNNCVFMKNYRHHYACGTAFTIIFHKRDSFLCRPISETLREAAERQGKI